MSRVLMLTCQFMPDVFGGAEKQCQRVANELAARGHRVTILTSTQKMKARGTRQEDDVVVKRVFTLFPPDLLGRWVLFSVYWLFLTTAWVWFRRGQFDIIHCHQGKFGAFVGTWLGKIIGKPILIKIGNSEEDMDLRSLKKKLFVGQILVDFILKNRPVFVGISQVIVKNLKDFGCRDVVHIPNGISVSHFSTGCDPRCASGDRITFFFHGRLEHIKRIEILISAFAEFILRGGDARLHLVGSGRSLMSSRLLCRSLGLDEKIVFHGEMPDAVDFIRRFDIFVNASRAEGFSNSLLEALALGKIMVSTPVSGASEAILEGVNGFISADFSAECLATAMMNATRLVGEKARIDAVRASQKLVTEKLSMDVVVDRYESLYQSMAASPRSA